MTGQLWYLQVLEGPHLSALSDRNRVRVRPLAAPRGMLYDRHGVPLVEARPSFVLSIVPRELTDRGTVLARLSILLKVPLAELQAALARVTADSGWPVRVRRDLTFENVARIEEVVALFVKRVIYSHYATTARLWGVSVLDDQALAWGLMGVVDGFVYFGAFPALVMRMALQEQRMTELEEALEGQRAEVEIDPTTAAGRVTTMVTASSASLATKAALWLISGIAGAVLFWLVQVLSGGPTIPDFMGEQIVDAGGYPARFASAIGWAVHLGVSLSYALLFGVIVLVLAATRVPARVAISFAVAGALGWVTAMVAPPAISVTISVVSGQGWPSELFPLNTGLGLPFWNHVGFFLLNWLVQGFGPRLLRVGAGRSAVAVALGALLLLGAGGWVASTQSVLVGLR